MFTLPRGVDVAEDVPLATTAWESPESVEHLAYRDGKELFLGAIPASENWPLLSEIYQAGSAAVNAVARSSLPPTKRAGQIKQLEADWRKALVADCVALGIDDDRHQITIAGSRSGKGTSAIIPNLCLYTGPVICLDPKAENANATALRRGPGSRNCEGMGQTVHVFDPFGIAKVPDELRSSFDPMALLDPDSDDVVTDADILAEGLIVPGDGRSAHWDESARTFIKGLILHLITTVERATLLTLRRFLTQGDREGWDKACLDCEDQEGDEPDAALVRYLKEVPSATVFLLKSMLDNEAFSGLIAGAAETLLACGADERGSILSTARRNTAFLDTLKPSFVEALQGNKRPFAPDMFKKDPKGATLYLCLPAQRMATHGRLLRVIIGLLLEWAYRDLSPPQAGSILFLLEEFATLGHMVVIEKAAGYAAGFGVKLWIIIQDLQQIKSNYKDSYQTLLANAGVVQVFGVSDPETTGYVSKALGEVEVIRNIKSSSTAAQRTGNDPSLQQRAANLAGGRNNIITNVATSLLPATATSEGETRSESFNQQIQVVPLLRPDEVTRQFARETGWQLLLIKGRLPICCLRVDYYNSPWFAGLYVPDRPGGLDPAARKSFDDHSPAALRGIAARFRVPVS